MVDLRRPRSPLRDARVANCSMIMTYGRGRGRILRVEGAVAAATAAEIDHALLVHLGLTP
jgi:hypothetical protein